MGIASWWRAIEPLGLACQQPNRGSEQGWLRPSSAKGGERHQPLRSHQEAGAVVAMTGIAAGLAGGETGKPLMPLTKATATPAASRLTA